MIVHKIQENQGVDSETPISELNLHRAKKKLSNHLTSGTLPDIQKQVAFKFRAHLYPVILAVASGTHD